MGEIPARVSDDAINPSHYKSHPSGVECIQITEHMSFLIGNAMKYLWRAGLKTDDPLEDLEKARWYLDRQIALIQTGVIAIANDELPADIAAIVEHGQQHPEKSRPRPAKNAADQVTTVTDLDALPVGSVIRDSTGQVWDRWAENCWMPTGTTLGRRSNQMGMYPMAVLYRGREK